MYGRNFGQGSTEIRFTTAEKPVLDTVARGLSLVCRAHVPEDCSPPEVKKTTESVTVPLVPDLSQEHVLIVAEGITAAIDLTGHEELLEAEERVDMLNDGLPFVFGAHILIEPTEES